MKRYRSFSEYLTEKYGCKVYKVSIDAGFTCPNRDGHLGKGGCIYCNNKGFSMNTRTDLLPVSDQINNGMEAMARRYKAKKFIAYFQAYTNTYAPVEKLRELYLQAIDPEDVIGISIGTRPDCVPDETIEMIAGIGENRETWIELGLQSAHDITLDKINRKHDVAAFIGAVERIKKYDNIKICAHVILGLPGESEEMMLDSADLLSDLGVDGIKIHLLHILKNTPLEKMYNNGEITLFSFEKYVQFVVEYLERLDENMIIQRLTADGPADVLVAPEWANEKRRTIDKIEKTLLKQNTRQGAKRALFEGKSKILNEYLKK